MCDQRINNIHSASENLGLKGAIYNFRYFDNIWSQANHTLNNAHKGNWEIIASHTHTLTHTSLH